MALMGISFRQLWATKAVDDLGEMDEAGNLPRLLGPASLVALGLGVIIGTGIFVLTGVAAAKHAGPALSLSFVIAAVGCALAGLCYAEFASLIPRSGSAYSYSYVTLGELVAWFIGWDLMLEYLIASGAVAVGWSAYMVSLLEQLGVHLPAALTQAPFAKGEGHGLRLTGALINLPAVLIVAIMTTLCYIGLRQSSVINGVIVVIKVAVIILFIGFGVFYINADYWQPFIPENTGRFGQFGWSGVLQAAAIIFYAYIGFDCVSTAAQEAKNPQRDMPIGILASLAICTLLYVAVTLVLTGMVPFAELNVAAPVAMALDRHEELHWLSGWLKLGAIAGITSVILVLIFGQARIFYAMSRDRLLPAGLSRVHPRFQTPYRATLLTGAAAAVIGGLFPIDLLGEMVSIGTLMAFVTVCIGVLVLRYTRPDLPRAFRVPLAWLICPAGVLVCGGLMYSLPADTWLRLGIWTVIGFGVYFAYGHRRSALRHA